MFFYQIYYRRTSDLLKNEYGYYIGRSFLSLKKPCPFFISFFTKEEVSMSNPTNMEDFIKAVKEDLTDRLSDRKVYKKV